MTRWCWSRTWKSAARDQKFNILMGRDLQTQYGQEEQVGLFMPILPGLDGVQKMSKSLDNYVGVTDEPNDMFGKLMSIPDDVMPVYFELSTDVPLDEIEQIKRDLASGAAHPMDVKKRLAREVVSGLPFRRGGRRRAGGVRESVQLA